MKLDLHPEAVKNYDKKGNILLSKLVPVPSKPNVICRNSFRPNFPVSAAFGKNDDKIVVEFGEYFQHKGQFISLKESQKEIEQLAREIQKEKPLYKIVSVALIINLVTNWMKDKYKNETDESMVNYLLSKSEASIQELEIWIPIAELYIQSEINIGRVTLKTIRKEMFEPWRTAIKNANPADDSKIQTFDKENLKIQGLVAATMKVNAEPIRAFEIALEEIEMSIELLRCFSPSNYFPENICRCVVLGKENIETTNHLVLKEGNLVQNGKAIVDKRIQPWIIDDVVLSVIQKAGLEIMSDILALEKEKRTGFQQRLLSSLKWYSLSSLMKNPSDKLFYIFVALEFFLIRNEKEPIQYIMGDAMAFFISSDSTERRTIAQNIRKAYKLRSDFVHHGKTIEKIEDLEILKEFMLNACTFFTMLMQNAKRFHDITEFFEEIESKKYS